MIRSRIAHPVALDLRRGVVLGLVHAVIVGVLLVATAAPAFAAKPSKNSGHGGGGSTAATGNDVSYPQCGTTLPSGQAFGIVGVNDGLANNLNPCLGPSGSYPSYSQSELYWAAATSTGSTSQPRVSLYVNTADPGNVYNGYPIADWPTSGGNLQYGTCTTTTVTTSSGTYTVGQNSTACAWQYGYNKASQDATWLTQAANDVNAKESQVPVSALPDAYPWWLDVETANSWQTGSSGQAMNVADLQGMVAALQQSYVTKIGAYSTASQWTAITGGTTSASGSLSGLPDWIPGARTLSGAQSNCGLPSFTQGVVPITQWASHPVDGDYPCP